MRLCGKKGAKEGDRIENIGSKKTKGHRRASGRVHNQLFVLKRDLKKNRTLWIIQKDYVIYEREFRGR